MLLGRVLGLKEFYHTFSNLQVSHLSKVMTRVTSPGCQEEGNCLFVTLKQVLFLLSCHRTSWGHIPLKTPHLSQFLFLFSLREYLIQPRLTSTSPHRPRMTLNFVSSSPPECQAVAGACLLCVPVHHQRCTNLLCVVRGLNMGPCMC